MPGNAEQSELCQTKLPEAKVNAEKEKLQKYEEMMEKVKTQLTQMDK